MIPLGQATELILDPVHALPVVRVELAAAFGSVLARDVVATHDTPPFDAAAMDGYAVRSGDVAAHVVPAQLDVVATAASGHPSDVVLTPGTAVRILTGAVVPQGADCIVPVESTDAGLEVVRVHRPAAPGQHIRRRGEVDRAGAVLLRAGTELGAGHLGVVASTGNADVAVHRRPRVVVVTTGDELVAPGAAPLGTGQIYESNGVVVRHLVASAGGTAQVYHVTDDAEALGRLLTRLGDEHDLVLTCGGISMGAEFDPVRAALASHPVRFEKVAIRPAKPLAFGSVGSSRFVGLPGNPVSVVVAFELFVRPLLRRLRGLPDAGPRFTSGTAGATIDATGRDVIHLVPVARSMDDTWSPTELAGSHALVGVVAAQALAVLGPDRHRVEPGEDLQLLPLWTGTTS